MNKKKITVLGIGYVGLPLAVELSHHFDVIAYDKNKKKIDDLKSGVDQNQQYSANQLKKNLFLRRIKIALKIQIFISFVVN